MFAIKEYDRDRALEYAARYAFSRNPLFTDFAGIGGDCTNFVSQCVLAGSCVMNFTPTYGWYYRSSSDYAPAFTGVEFFWKFFVGDPEFAKANGGTGPFGREVAAEETLPGDVVQLSDRMGFYYHTLMISSILDGEIYVTGHTNDVYDRPLLSYSAEGFRFLHIEGVRFTVENTPCFTALIEGKSLPLT